MTDEADAADRPGGERGILARLPMLACPQCKGELIESDCLHCPSCGESYDIRDGVPHMLRGDMKEFANEIAVQDRVAQEYEQKRYSRPYAKMYHHWWTGLMLRGVRTEGVILDNGCGIGLLLDRLPPDNIVQLDISSEMLHAAARRTDRLILGNSQQLPLKSGSFDTVICRSLFHHLPDPESAVEEAARVLSPNGQIVLVDTNSSLLSSIPRRLARKSEHFSEVHKNLDRRTLETWLRPHFIIDEVRYFGYVAYPLLGFPDLVDVFQFCPVKSLAQSALMGFDNLVSKVPGLRTLSWAILIRATKR